MGPGDSGQSCVYPYLLVVDGEESEHGSEHGTGSHKVAQTTNVVGDKIPAHKCQSEMKYLYTIGSRR